MVFNKGDRVVTTQSIAGNGSAPYVPVGCNGIIEDRLLPPFEDMYVVKFRSPDTVRKVRGSKLKRAD